MDRVRTLHGGNEAPPLKLGAAVHDRATSKLDLDPRLITLYAGYPFSVDYRETRGHAYMLTDQDLTERTKRFNQSHGCSLQRT